MISDQVLNDLVRDIKQAGQWKAARLPGGKPFWQSVSEDASDMYVGYTDPENAFNCIVRCAVKRVWARTNLDMLCTGADSGASSIDEAVANSRVRRAVLVMLRRRTDGRFLPDPSLPVVVNDAVAFARMFSV